MNEQNVKFRNDLTRAQTFPNSDYVTRLIITSYRLDARILVNNLVPANFKMMQQTRFTIAKGFEIISIANHCGCL